MKDGTLDMIAPEDGTEAYGLVCDQLGYDAMGVPASEDDDRKFEEYRWCGDLGFLEERRWKNYITWSQPPSESAKCWFVANAGVADKTAEPNFVLRSLVTLRMHLKHLSPHFT